MHEFRRYVQSQMDARGWDRTELRRRSGLSRQQLHRILTDERERLPERPEPQTIEALAKAFGVGSQPELWINVAAAMGLPVGTQMVADAALLPDDDLLRELAARLHAKRAGGSTGRQVQITPAGYEDARQIAEALRRGDDIALDLSKCGTATAKRLVDFVAGAAFGLGFGIERVTSRTFLITRGQATADRHKTSVALVVDLDSQPPKRSISPDTVAANESTEPAGAGFGSQAAADEGPKW